MCFEKDFGDLKRKGKMLLHDCENCDEILLEKMNLSFFGNEILSTHSSLTRFV